MLPMSVAIVSGTTKRKYSFKINLAVGAPERMAVWVNSLSRKLRICVG